MSMVKDGNTRATFSLPEDLVDELDEQSKRGSRNKSQIVEDALREHLDKGSLSRIESKVDEIRDLLDDGETPSDEVTEEKEKSAQDVQEETTSSEKPVKERRADQMYEYLKTELADDAGLLSESHFEKAIAKVWSDSDHMIAEYTPKIEERLRANGWKYVDTRGLWCETDEAFKNQIRSVYESSRRMINGEHSSREDINDQLVTVRQKKDTFVEYDVATEDEINRLLDDGVERATGLSA